MRIMNNSVTADCNHCASGVCSKCWLFRAYSLKSVPSSVDGVPPLSLESAPVPNVDAAPAPAILTSKLPYVDPSLSNYKFLPISTINCREENPPTVDILPMASGPLSIDPAQLSTGMSILSPRETYTSFPVIQEKQLNGDENTTQESIMVQRETEKKGVGSWLLRLFESDRMDIVLAMHYLHNAKEKGVFEYLGNKLFHFNPKEVDFYVPQLIYLYLDVDEVSMAISPYLVSRCKTDVHFSLSCLWLLDSFGHERNGLLRNKEPSLRQQLEVGFREERRGSLTGHGVAHSRSISDATLSSNPPATSMRRVESSLSTLGYLCPGALTQGRPFGNCDCFEDDEDGRPSDNTTCVCGFDRMKGEQEFVQSLTSIGDRLRLARNKKEKSSHLVRELQSLNNRLPSRVWIPLYGDSGEHIVLRIPPTSGCVLNSKDKAPYCIFVEVLTCVDALRVRVPPRLSEAQAELHERLHSLTKGTLPNGSDVGYTVYKEDPNREIPVIQCRDKESEWWDDDRMQAGEIASDTLSQKSMESWNSNDEKTIRPADIRRRLKEWVKRPRRQMRHNPEDPSAHAMSEPWEEKRERIRLSSPYGRMAGWQLLPVIVKTGDDLRQELLAYQLLRTLEKIWSEENVSLFLRPYKIIVLSHDSGMIEPIVNACSLHQIKRNQSAIFSEEGRSGIPSLLSHFTDTFGAPHTESFLRAQHNLVQSCAAYSLACYFLQVKDRHNGNILIDSEGHLIHIDFGFILSASPRNLGFETSPFKLTSEMIDVMGGTSSDLFDYFKILMLQGMLAARKHSDRVMNIVEIMMHGSPLACFRGGASTLRAMRDRFHISYTEAQLQALIDQMVESSRDSLTTRLYDNYQYYSNGIL